MSKPHLPALDGLRGLAVLTVLIFHTAGGAKSHFLPLRIFGQIVQAGWVGVTLFFVLSGFLITGILWDSKGESHWWRNFYMRRSLRIFPLYYFALLLVLIAAACVGTFHEAFAKIWSPALFLQNIPGPNQNIFNDSSPFELVHFWSLAVEEQFYLLWPFMLLLVKTRKGALRLAAGVFLFSALFRLIVWTTLPNARSYNCLLFTRCGEMAAGAWLAIAYRDELWSSVKRYAPWALFAGFALFTGVCLSLGSAIEWLDRQVIVGFLGITVGFAALLVMSLQEGLVQRMMSARWLRWLGGISYGLYVYQLLLKAPFVALAAAVVGQSHRNLFLATTSLFSIAGTIGISWLSYQYFEKPLLRLKRYFPTAGPLQAAAPTPAISRQ